MYTLDSRFWLSHLSITPYMFFLIYQMLLWNLGLECMTFKAFQDNLTYWATRVLSLMHTHLSLCKSYQLKSLLVKFLNIVCHWLGIHVWTWKMHEPRCIMIGSIGNAFLVLWGCYYIINIIPNHGYRHTIEISMNISKWILSINNIYIIHYYSRLEFTIGFSHK